MGKSEKAKNNVWFCCLETGESVVWKKCFYSLFEIMLSESSNQFDGQGSLVDVSRRRQLLILHYGLLYPRWKVVAQDAVKTWSEACSRRAQRRIRDAFQRRFQGLRLNEMIFGPSTSGRSLLVSPSFEWRSVLQMYRTVSTAWEFLLAWEPGSASRRSLLEKSA